MKIPTFTLVHRGATEPKAAAAWTSNLAREMPAIQPLLAGLQPKYRQLKKTLLASLVQLDPVLLATKVTDLQTISSELQRQKSVTTVGVWDLGARVARLPNLIEQLNAAQPTFVFFEIQAGIPAGLISQPERIVAWAKEQLGRPLGPNEQRDIQRNVIADDFFPRAESVRSDLGIDYLVGLTPSMVAGAEEDSVYWNHISTYQDKTVLASMLDLRTFAQRAGRPFEALVGGVIVAQLLVAMFNERGLNFHPEDRGCLFDYNESRVSIVEAAKNPRIEPECLQFIPPAFRTSAVALVEALKAYNTKI